jgi:hypothetical protein
MSGNLPSGVTDAITSGRAPTMEEVAEVLRPCRWEKMSGICMKCGAGPDDECEVERERR